MLLLKPVVFNCTQTWGCRRTTGFSPQLCCIELTSLCFTLNSTSRPLILLDQFHYESSKCAVWVCVLQCFTSSFSTTLSPTSLPPTSFLSFLLSHFSLSNYLSLSINFWATQYLNLDWRVVSGKSLCVFTVLLCGTASVSVYNTVYHSVQYFYLRVCVSPKKGIVPCCIVKDVVW